MVLFQDTGLPDISQTEDQRPIFRYASRKNQNFDPRCINDERIAELLGMDSGTLKRSQYIREQGCANIRGLFGHFMEKERAEKNVSV